MFAGHAAMGLALGAQSRDRSVVAVVVASSLFADVAWCCLTLIGVEGGRSLGSQVFHSPRLPWSHALVSSVAFAFFFAAVAAVAAQPERRGKAAALAAAAALLHWVLGDVPFGEAFPLLPTSEPLPMLHLYARWPVAFLLELLTLAVCAALAAPYLGRKRALVFLAVMGALHLFCWVPTFVGAPAVDLDAQPERIVLYLVMLLVAGAVTVGVTPRAPHPPVVEGAGRGLSSQDRRM